MKTKQIRWNHLVFKNSELDKFLTEYIEEVAPREMQRANQETVKRLLISIVHPKDKAKSLFRKLVKRELINVHSEIEMWMPNGKNEETNQPIYKSTFGRVCEGQPGYQVFNLIYDKKGGRGNNGNSSSTSTW